MSVKSYFIYPLGTGSRKPLGHFWDFLMYIAYNDLTAIMRRLIWIYGIANFTGFIFEVSSRVFLNENSSTVVNSSILSAVVHAHM